MDREKWEQLIKRAPYAQKLINKNMILKTKEYQLAAVKQNGSNIQFIRDPDKDVQLEAVKEDGRSIQYIRDPDKDVQLEAVRKGHNIQYIRNPDKDVQLEAVKNGDIQFIINPDKEVIIHYLLQICPDLLQDPEYDLKDWDTEETTNEE